QQGRTLSDAGLILRAYRVWGDDCPARLLGDFAFAIWDGRHNHLLAARDHLGAKSLYYLHKAGFFAFASEPKALQRLAVLAQVINPAWVASYLSLTSCIEPGETIWKGIYQLPPAHRLVVTGEKVALHRYWALNPQATIRLGSDGEYAEALRL